jgi:hypothetical protein
VASSLKVQTGGFIYTYSGYPGLEGRHSYQVDVGVGGDVEGALAHRMIEIIQVQYKGHFKWRSRKQGKMVNLDVRDEDELQKFIKQEMF